MIVIDGHGIMQFFSTAAERLFGWCRAGGDRPERQHPDAGARPLPPRRLYRALSHHQRSAHHRHRPHRDRQAPRRHDLSDAPVDRRDAVRRRALFHRLRPRPYRASADPGAAPGIAIRTRPRLAAERDGRDGVGARPRAQPAAGRDQQLHEGIATAAGRQHRSQHAEDRERDGPRRRAGAARRPDHPPPARLRLPRRIREAGREPVQADRGGRRARARRRARAERAASLQPRSRVPISCSPTGCRSSRCWSICSATRWKRWRSRRSASSSSPTPASPTT